MSCAEIQSVLAYLDELLSPSAFADYGPNGLQVPGPEEIGLVVTGVSAHAELLEQAAALDADLVLVHHGLFWRGQPLQITPVVHRRLKVLYGNDMALAAYHLPLDAHPEHGNNALLAAGLGLADITALGDIGTAGTLGEPESIDAFAVRVAGLVGREPLVIEGGPGEVRRVGIVSGGATDYVWQAIEAGCDTFLTGEPAERAYGIARDTGIHFIAAGHHATETFGVRRLGELLERRFGIGHRFIDVPNPI